MSDPRHFHEFLPNRKGRCKRIIGSAICGMTERAMVHRETYTEPPSTPTAILTPECAVIRIRKLPDDSAHYDIEVGFTPGMETAARDALERMFGYAVGRRDESEIRPYVDAVMRERRNELVELTKGIA